MVLQESLPLLESYFSVNRHKGEAPCTVLLNSKVEDGKLVDGLKRSFNAIYNWSENSDWQALVGELRTIWGKIGEFDIEKIREFLKPTEVPGIPFGCLYNTIL